MSRLLEELSDWLVPSAPSTFSVSSETTSQLILNISNAEGQLPDSCCGVTKEGIVDMEHRQNGEGMALNKLGDIEVTPLSFRPFEHFVSCLISLFISSVCC